MAKLDRIEVIDMAWWFVKQNINPEVSERAKKYFEERTLNEIIEKYILIQKEIQYI